MKQQNSALFFVPLFCDDELFCEYAENIVVSDVVFIDYIHEINKKTRRVKKTVVKKQTQTTVLLCVQMNNMQKCSRQSRRMR